MSGQYDLEYSNMRAKKTRQYNKIPKVLSKKEFNEFVLPHLKTGSRGPSKKISFFKLFNYILKFMHTGCQWECLPIEKDTNGNPEIHYNNVFRTFKFWVKHKCFDKIFKASVVRLFQQGMLNTDIIHGDGTCTAAKKGVII